MDHGTFGSDFPVDRRSAARIAPASMTYAHFGHAFAGVVVNISEKGFSLATSLSLITDPLPSVQIRINGIVEPTTATGRAVWTDESTQRVGIEILAMKAPDRLRLKQWIKLQIFEASLKIDETSEVDEFVVGTAFASGVPEQHDEQSLALVGQENALERRGSIVEEARHATLVVVGQKTHKKNLVLGAAAILTLAAGLVLVLHNVPSIGRLGKHAALASRPTLEENVDSSIVKPGPSSEKVHGHSDGTDLDLAVETAENLETQSDPTSIWIDPKDHATHGFVKLPSRPLLRSGSLAVTSQRSLFITGTDRPDTRKQLLVVGRLISWTRPDVGPLEGIRHSEIRVQVRALVGSKGEIVDLKPISGPAKLFPAVLKAVREWRYEPTLLDGMPIDIQVDLTIAFHPLGIGDQEI